MIIHDVDQRSPQWYALRMGIPTGSNFDKIVTPAKGELSKSSDEYCNKLLWELFSGQPADLIPAKTYWMERGAALEIEARQLYEFKYDIQTASVGFVTNDEGTLGASPDCFAGENGMVEIKCPAPWTHIANLLSGEVDRSYWPQVQGQLLVCEKEWSDWMSYHPDMPPSIIRTNRDEGYLTKMDAALKKFCSLFQERKEELIAKGMTIKPIIIPEIPQKLTINDFYMAG